MGRTAAARVKTERLEARLTPEQNDLIDAAAAAKGVSRTAFVVQAAMDSAHRFLKSEQVTLLAASQASSIAKWLDRPAEVLPEMKRLVDAPVLPHR